VETETQAHVRLLESVRSLTLGYLFTAASRIFVEAQPAGLTMTFLVAAAALIVFRSLVGTRPLRKIKFFVVFNRVHAWIAALASTVVFTGTWLILDDLRSAVLWLPLAVGGWMAVGMLWPVSKSNQVVADQS
jgi:uncharacterized membrane protein (UPF0136 family)